MRLFYAAHDQGNQNINSLTWYNNLFLPLQDISHEVIRFDFDLFPLALHQDIRRAENKTVMDFYRPILEKELLFQIEKSHKEKPIDIFFSYFSSSYCSYKVIEKINEMGITTINWFCNASYQFQLIKEIAPAYNYCLVPEKIRLIDYKQIGANPIYCQEAANPSIYKPFHTSQDYNISFVGTNYADRSKYIYSLYYNNIQVNVWGEKWKYQKPNPANNLLKKIIRPLYHNYKKIKPLTEELIGPFIPEDEMVKIFSKSKINLGFSNCWVGNNNQEAIKQVRLRDFEIPMSGGFYLTQYNEELSEFFEPGKEIVFFNNIKDCIEKSKYFLNHPDEREIIRKAGYQRAINEHTWQKRFQYIFSSIGKL